jgi:endoglucanase
MDRRKFLGTAITASAASVFTNVYGKNLEHIAQEPISYSNIPRWRGFNLQEKFTHKPDEWLDVAPEWGMNNEPFRKSDFEWISEFGFDYVRLPMSYKCWIKNDDWYQIREDKLKEIDLALDYGREFNLHVCINFHRAPGYTINDRVFKPKYREKKSLWDDEEALDACAFHWKLFAERYKGIPNSRLSFNLFNEPVETTEEKHDRVLRRVVNDIREIDANRLIFIDGFNFEPSHNLIDLKLAQCARGYEPLEVTHYKATWWADERRNTLPHWPMKNIEGEWLDREYLKEKLKAWKNIEKQGVGVHVGEMGCYNHTPHNITLKWLKDNLELWKEAGYGWAMWCLRGSFGIIDSGRSDIKYEKFRGHLLDRKMLNLLQEH